MLDSRDESLMGFVQQSHPPLPPAHPVVEGKSPVARRVDGDRKPAHLGVEDLVVPPQVGGLPDVFLIQFQSVDHGSLPYAHPDTGVDSRPYQAKHGGRGGMQAETGIGEGRGVPVIANLVLKVER